jgi:outer membrane lipoprotein LolB
VIRALVGILLAGAMAGCANQIRPTPTVEGPEQLWAARQVELHVQETWTLDGRLAIQRGTEGGQARIHWAQTGSAFELKIIAPMSRGTYLMHGDADRVVLETPDHKRYEAPDLATLMTTHLRWNLPVAGARYWVLGIPAPGEAPTNLLLDAAGRLTDMAQDGWRISVLDYQTVGTQTLPRRLFLTANDLQLRLAITQWPTPPR